MKKILLEMKKILRKIRSIPTAVLMPSIGGVSFGLLVGTFYVLMANEDLSMRHKVILIILLQLSGGFFFPITIGKVIQRIRHREVASVLWDFISECGRARLLRFYASREGNAEKDLKERFDNHRKGPILMTGPSLRLFFAPGSLFYSVINRNIGDYERAGVNILVVNADIKNNICLPIRCFVEEFEPDGKRRDAREEGPRAELPWMSDNFDWNDSIEAGSYPGLVDFYSEFHDKWGIDTRDPCRSLVDLRGAKVGIRELNSLTKGRVIRKRTTICAPYFTAVIFPDVCFYTPNMLWPDAPVNMPMLTFQHGGPAYERILAHFKFLWWSGTTDKKEEKPQEIE